jgi:3-oxoacyl-[acyl-carrier protein] reductase
VNSINPGVVETDGTHSAGIIGGDFKRQAVKQTRLADSGSRPTSRRSQCF